MARTASALIATVCNICRCPGFTVEAGQFLNDILDDLCQHKDLKVNRVTSSFTLQAGSNGPTNLEADYLRTYDMFYYVGGDPFFLNPSNTRQFDADADQNVGTGYPFEYNTDLSAVASGGVGLLYVFDAPSSATTITHRYMTRRASIVSPEASQTIPWMTDQTYLIAELSARLMMLTDDERQPGMKQQAEDQLRQHLIMEGDEQAVVRRVELDWRTFRTGNGVRKTKTSPY